MRNFLGAISAAMSNFPIDEYVQARAANAEAKEAAGKLAIADLSRPLLRVQAGVSLPNRHRMKLAQAEARGDGEAVCDNCIGKVGSNAAQMTTEAQAQQLAKVARVLDARDRRNLRRASSDHEKFSWRDQRAARQEAGGAPRKGTASFSTRVWGWSGSPAPTSGASAAVLNSNYLLRKRSHLTNTGQRVPALCFGSVVRACGQAALWRRGLSDGGPGKERESSELVKGVLAPNNSGEM